jgi:hypothetical protein
MTATSTVYAPIMNALLALLKVQCGTLFQTYTRRLVMWEQLAQSLQSGGTLIRQPYLCLFDGTITTDSGTIRYHRQGMGVPARREMDKTIVIYAQLPSISAAGNITAAGIDSFTPGGDIFYPLIEAVESALEPHVEPQGALTLGGKVFRCWIEGNSYMFPGDIDPNGQGMAIVPVKIMLP